MPAPLSLHSHKFRAMGTDCALHIYASNNAIAATAVALAHAEAERIELKYSRYDSKSLVSAINQAGAAGTSIEVDEETGSLLDYAFACYAKSDGLFDITAGILRQCWDFSSRELPAKEALEALLPRIGLRKLDWRPPVLCFRRPGMEIDLGGIGKEYAVDQLGTLLRNFGIRHGLVDLGGDMTVLGPHPDGRPWSIGLRNPRHPDDVVTNVVMRRGAIATSGDYERCIEIDGRRYGHILDPETGWPVAGLASVTVLAASCLVAGSVATIAMLKGREGLPWLKSLGVPYFSVDEDGRQDGTLPATFEASPISSPI
jgi:thiamine biosynthesis lipoprotein